MIDRELLAQRGYLGFGDLTETPIDLRRLFGRTARVEMEIGAGRGDFAIEYARSRPDVDLLGVERSLAVLRRASAKLLRAPMPNLVFLHVEIKHLLETYIAPGALSAIHVYFPDPWPKKRHAKRRLIQSSNIELMLRALRNGGELHFRTDHATYFAAARELLDGKPELDEISTPTALAGIQTGFEHKFVTRGRRIYRLSYSVRERG